MPLETRTSEQGLFGELAASARGVKAGVLPSQDIQDLISTGKIVGRSPILEEQIQPASLDLRVGDMAHRVQASFLPGQHATVEQWISELRMSRVDLTSATVLEKGCVYIVPLLEEVHLPDNMSGKANPKSTTGRLDVFTRLITDYGVEFEHVPPGYKGKLYAEIVPGTFSIRLPAGTRLNQLRFFRGNPLASDTLITELDGREALVYSREDSPVKAQVDRGLRISVNLHSVAPSEIRLQSQEECASDRPQQSEPLLARRVLGSEVPRRRQGTDIGSWRFLHSCIQGTDSSASRLRGRDGSV